MIKCKHQMKNKIREKLLTHRLKLSQKEVEKFSEKITEKIKRLPEFKKAKVVLLYHPIKNEVDPTPLFENPQTSQKKIFAFPLTHADSRRMTLHQIADLNELELDEFKIKSPTRKHQKIARKNIDLVITPGLAFDPDGNRIGYGKGYFDKLFKNLSTNCTKIALAYDFQIIENVPAEKHDKKVEIIVTEKRTIRTGFMRRHSKSKSTQVQKN